MKKKANAVCKVTKVYTHKGKQLLFDVLRVDGLTAKLAATSMQYWVWYKGYDFENATVSENDFVRVSKDVPREELDIRQYEGRGNVFGPFYEVINGKLIYVPYGSEF